MIALLAAAGTALVVVSWMVPEPVPRPAPVVPISNLACVAKENAPPSYGNRGTRALGNECVR